MNFLDEIYQAFTPLNNWVASQQSSGSPAPVISWLRVSELNDYAFFVLMFGQLEDYINREYEGAVGPWEETAFEHRVNILFGKMSPQAGVILEYYDLRCDVAHGHAESGQMGERISVLDVYRNIQAIISY